MLYSLLRGYVDRRLDDLLDLFFSDFEGYREGVCRPSGLFFFAGSRELREELCGLDNRRETFPLVNQSSTKSRQAIFKYSCAARFDSLDGASGRVPFNERGIVRLFEKRVGGDVAL